MIRKKFGNSNMNHARRAKNDEFYVPKQQEFKGESKKASLIY